MKKIRSHTNINRDEAEGDREFVDKQLAALDKDDDKRSKMGISELNSEVG